jgi:sterol desaturase/sphingolipid hydroxylase (fatty acid hydroxylase superfamily)
MSVEQAALIRVLFVWGGFAFFLVLELVAPYRASTVSKPGRWVTNLSLTAFNGVLLNLAFSAAILGTTAYVAQHRSGVLHLLDLSGWARLVAVVVFMDFTLYVWHLLNHKMPLLWRFHRVHHSDLNMDVSTATRFHIGELIVSAAIKLGLIFFLGVTLAELIVFEVLLVLSAQFQHSVLRVPAWFERIYLLLFVPPSMHRIHHSVIIRERDTNYGTIFSVWDRVMGTLLADVDQKGIRIGMGAFQNPAKLGVWRLISMPFT